MSSVNKSIDILCRYSLDILNIRAHETIFRGDLMKPNARRQKEMFVSTMTELLWKVKLSQFNSLLPLGRYIDMDPSTTELVVSQTQFIRFGQFLLG